MDGLTVGRIVHFVMPNGKHRPAIIVEVHNVQTGVVNLQVFTDGLNDEDQNLFSNHPYNLHVATGLLWRTSIIYSEQHESGTWHWIERA